jgi:probable rRNA maturation factor
VTTRLVLRIEAPAWRRRLPAAEAIARRAARAALAAAAKPRRPSTAKPLRTNSAKPRRQAAAGGELCIVLANDRLQRGLNHTFRGADKSTNVLSFEDGERGPGDVVLALETIAREAKAQGKSLADHLTHLVVHGVLHLMGYDHEKESGARRMERLEVKILAGLAIADPYRADPPRVPPVKRLRRA